MSKYVKLTSDQTEWDSALFSQKPLPIKRHPDDQIQQFNWYPVKEHKERLKDRQMYQHERASWELVDSTVNIHYTSVLKPVEQRREAIKARIQSVRDAKTSGGLYFDGIEYQTDTSSYENVLGATTKAYMDSSHTEVWIAADNTEHFMDAKTLIQFGDVFMSFKRSHIFHARELKNQVNVSADPENIDIHTGWPTNEFFSK